jgi:hypothetical protein
MHPSSADGTKLVAAVGGYKHSGPIYTSTNGGTTWTQGIIAENWTSVASSADGSKLYALSSTGQFYISTNSLLVPPGAAHWISKPAPDVWTIASSTDGTKLIAAGGQIYTSTNSGTTWITNNSFSGRYWWSVALSADGTRLAAVDGAGGPAHIYTSPDFGTTWILNNVPLLSWQYIAMSADGNELIAAAWIGSAPPTGPIYTSTNSGLTWTSNNVPNVTWQGVTCSADGNEFVAVSAGNGNFSQGTGHIWIWQSQPSPQLTLTPSPPDLTLGWTIPSTNFMLQQSADLLSWVDVTNQPVLNLTNLQDQVTFSPSNSSAFYRLKTP